jgi:hypothetical protein
LLCEQKYLPNKLLHELRMLCAARMTKMRADAGFIGRWLEAWLHAGSGEPLDGVFFRVTHFGTAAPGRRFMAPAIATGSRDAL